MPPQVFVINSIQTPSTLLHRLVPEARGNIACASNEYLHNSARFHLSTVLFLSLKIAQPHKHLTTDVKKVSEEQTHHSIQSFKKSIPGILVPGSLKYTTYMLVLL